MLHGTTLYLLQSKKIYISVQAHHDSVLNPVAVKVSTLSVKANLFDTLFYRIKDFSVLKVAFQILVMCLRVHVPYVLGPTQCVGEYGVLFFLRQDTSVLCQ